MSADSFKYNSIDDDVRRLGEVGSTHKVGWGLFDDDVTMMS